MTRTVVVGLTIVALAAGVVAVRRFRSTGAEKPAQWRTATVARKSLVVSVTGSGSISPASEVEVKSRATGTVTAVYVSEGDRVAKGQVLVRLNDVDAAAAVAEAAASLQSAQAGLAQSEAERRAQQAQTARSIQQAEANLAAARARLRGVQAGTRPEELAQAEATVRSAQSDLDLAKANHTRNEQLFQQGFIARQTLDQTAAQLRAAEEQYRIVQEKLRLARAGATASELDEARASVAQAEASLAQARAALLSDQVLAQAVASARASVTRAGVVLRNAQDRLAETEIRAPVAGLVSDRAVEVGQTVIGGASTSGTSVITLAVVEPLLGKVMVDEADIASVRSGLEAQITADALPDQRFSARVEAVSPNSQVENNVVQYEVILRLTGPTAGLRLGMTVDAELILMRRDDVLTVPRDAVRGEESKMVMVVKDGALSPTPVTVGGSDGRAVEITSGLTEGQVVYLGEAAAATGSTRNTTTRQTNPFLPAPPGGRR
jgi:HlyD family secretion protein